MSDLTRYDAERLHLLITQPRALHRLEARRRDPRRLGRNICPMFRKVMPVEYRRALAEMAKEKAAQCRLPNSRHG